MRTNGEFNLGGATGGHREGPGPGDPERPGGRTEQLRPHDCEEIYEKGRGEGFGEMGWTRGNGEEGAVVQSRILLGLPNC